MTADDRASRAAAQWRSERPDLDPFPMEVLGRLAELTQLVARDHVHPLFAAAGLHAGEFDVLATLRRSGPPYELTPTALYEATMVSSGGMTSRLDRLEKAGLVARRPHPEDRRASLVALTAAGHDLLDDLLPRHVENERRVLAGLEAAEQQQLNALLAKLLRSLSAASGAAADQAAAGSLTATRPPVTGSGRKRTRQR